MKDRESGREEKESGRRKKLVASHRRRRDSFNGGYTKKGFHQAKKKGRAQDQALEKKNSFVHKDLKVTFTTPKITLLKPIVCLIVEFKNLKLF